MFTSFESYLSHVKRYTLILNVHVLHSKRLIFRRLHAIADLQLNVFFISYLVKIFTIDRGDLAGSHHSAYTYIYKNMFICVCIFTYIYIYTNMYAYITSQNRRLPRQSLHYRSKRSRR
jgi:hypothetical protein